MFTEELYKKNEDYKNLKVESVLIDKKNASITLNFIGRPEYIDRLTQETRTEIKTCSEEILRTFFKVETGFKKAYADEANIIALTFDYLNEEFPSILSGADSSDANVVIDRENGAFTLKLGFDEYMKGFAETVGLCRKIKEHLESRLLERANVETYKSDRVSDAYKLREIKPTLLKSDAIRVTDAERVYGKTILSYPRAIKTISDEADNVVLCGKISRFDKRFAKNTGNPYYLFELSDTTGQISGKLFPRKSGAYKNTFADSGSDGDVRERDPKPKKSDADALDGLKDNEEIVACGSIKSDTFSKELAFFVTDINRCKIDYSSIEKDESVYNEIDAEYSLIHPKAYTEEVQQDFLSGDNEIPPFLRGRTFVVFDTETTGLDRTSDKIIELAAVKIVDGVMTETFSTFLNPGTALPAVITEITHITDADLVHAPKIGEVFPDFCKFISGAALVAHNIEFDIDFIRRAAKESRYRVDNELYDTLSIARKKHTVANYKLGTLCEHFGITLTDAHRAIYDTIDTAQLILIMAKDLS
ncbi:MAG: ribonuclease H-like domain-containing protein [Clostridiales bacterium]|jgi:DNA polymerase III epsilon subunit family exonuclease|nr:ribonuclease H-like domain-containing protein [Clostridiales bacterium]